MYVQGPYMEDVVWLPLYVAFVTLFFLLPAGPEEVESLHLYAEGDLSIIPQTGVYRGSGVGVS